MGIGSGGQLCAGSGPRIVDGNLEAEAIVRKAMEIAADICVYTQSQRDD